MAAAARVHHHEHHQKAAGNKGAREERRLKHSPPTPLHVEEGRGVGLREREKPTRCGEVAGGTAAGCAAVCCCVPLAILELVIAAVRVPAALCSRAVRDRRRRRCAAARRKEMEEPLARNSSPGSLAAAKDKHAAAAAEEEGWAIAAKPSAELSDTEKEVWASFDGAGFWRSPSQRERQDSS